jgi:hypothetical protein
VGTNLGDNNRAKVTNPFIIFSVNGKLLLEYQANMITGLSI